MKYFDNLTLIQEISGLHLTSEEAISEDQLLEYLNRVLELDLVISKTNNIKSIRDKHLAHNEYGFEGLDLNTFWDEVKDLQDIAALYLTIIGNHFLNVEVFQFNEIGRNKVHFSLLSDSARINWCIGGRKMEKVGRFALEHVVDSSSSIFANV